MNALLFLLPIALGLGALSLTGFIWAQRHGQYDDLDGAAQRLLLDDDSPPAPEPRL